MKRIQVFTKGTYIIHLYEVDNVMVGPKNGKYLGSIQGDEWQIKNSADTLKAMGIIQVSSDPRR